MALLPKGRGVPVKSDGLTNGTTYTFKVKATNAVGTGPASPKSNPVTPAKVPGAPRGVTATAGNGEATVSFKAPTSNGGSPITSYTAISSPGGITAKGAGSPITVTGLHQWDNLYLQSKGYQRDRHWSGISKIQPSDSKSACICHGCVALGP